MLRTEHQKEELYLLPEEERLAKTVTPLSDPTHLFEHYEYSDWDEVFGLARADLDFVTDARKPNKK